jgi:hypothetical protein
MAGTLITNSIAPDVGTNLYLNATQGAANVVIGNTTTALATFTNAGTLIVSNVIGSIANTNITGNIISSQITSVSNTQITGTITNNVNSFLVTANTLSDGTNSTSATNCIRGSAKAWVNFDGTTASPSTIRSSFNVTSVTKNGTGDYTVNFTNAFSDANYSMTSSSANTAPTMSIASPKLTATPFTTSAASVETRNTSSGALLDCQFICLSFFR